MLHGIGQDVLVGLKQAKEIGVEELLVEPHLQLPRTIWMRKLV
jgi:hypothetical protein